MNVKEAIQARRAYRSLDPIEVSKELIDDLMECAQLAPSCKNTQPWKFVFVYSKEQLKKVFSALLPSNKWVERASLVIVVCSDVQEGCIIKERLYYLYDTGMASAFLMLRATELGVVAHPIAGFDEAKVKQALAIPFNIRVISLIICGKHSKQVYPELTEFMALSERDRPRRNRIRDFTFINQYKSYE